ncbi:MAG: potassium transporter TrkG, partial [Chloroflexota bacterium]
MIKHDKPDEHSREYLLERYTDLIGYTGSFVSIIGGLYLVPLLVLIFYSEDIADAWGFIVTSLLLIVSGGYVSRRYSPDTPTRFTPQESAVIVILVWLIGILGGALPFMFHADLGFAQAVFESTSGWTTTGLTMVDVTEVSRVVLFYRSFIQFLGGLGFMIIALTVLSGSVGVMEAEGHNDRLGIGVKGTARQVLAIYGGYAFFGVALLRLVGMDWFDAVNHAFTALSTGGFSTKPESIAHWDSASVEAVIILLMILGGTNFLTAFTILRGRVRRALRCHELRFAVAVGAIAIITLLLFTTLSHYPTVGQAVRVAVFESVTAISGAGFNIADYPSLPRFAWMVIIILMLMGGVSGSTSGGIKLFRIYILLRSVLWEIKYLLFWPHVVKQP